MKHLGLVTDTEMRQIFGNIEDLIKVHQVIYPLSMFYEMLVLICVLYGENEWLMKYLFVKTKHYIPPTFSLCYYLD